MTRCARRVAPAALAVALIMGWPAPAHAVLVEGSFQGFVDSSFTSPVSPSIVSGTLRYDTAAPSVLNQTATTGQYLFTAPGSAMLGVTYADLMTGAPLTTLSVDAPSIQIGVQGGLDVDTVFRVTADTVGRRLVLSIEDVSGTHGLRDGTLPTASFPVGFDARFIAIDFSNPNAAVQFPPALIRGDVTLAVVPEPRAPIAALGPALLMMLWLRRRPRQRARATVS
jgi:hypothetical protein